MVTRGTRVTPRRDRELALRQELLASEWELIPNKPNSDPFLVLLKPGQWFATIFRRLEEDGPFCPCYVNFQRPLQRTLLGFDSDDLCLDLRLSDSGSWKLKDLEDYQDRVELGIYSDLEQTSVQAALDLVRSLIRDQQAPFDGSWRDWQPASEWTDLVLPEGWDRIEE